MAEEAVDHGARGALESLTELEERCRAIAASCPDPARRSEFSGFIDGAVRQFRRHVAACTATPDVAPTPTAPQVEERAFSVTPAAPALRAEYVYKPIGVFNSPFPELNGCPRQAMLAPAVRGVVRFFGHVQPKDALRGLSGYSHVWIVGAFHANTNMRYRPVVQPPLMDGARTGVFSTRSPHRPNSISLSLARIARVDTEAAELHVLGVDLVDGTPVLDVKPFVKGDVASGATWPAWLDREPLAAVEWEPRARERLEELRGSMRSFGCDAEAAARAIDDVLRLDVRTAHARKKHAVPVYGVCVDAVNVVFSVDDEHRVVHVINVELWTPSSATSPQPPQTEGDDGGSESS